MGRGDPNYALSRIELEGAGTFGWQVRLQRQGKRFGLFFSDSAHGGSDGSLKRARQWRDNLLVEIDQRNEIARNQKRAANNSSGVIGVSKVTVRTNGASYEFWQASWSPEPGRRKTVKFSITRYGHEEAFRLAVEARERAVR